MQAFAKGLGKDFYQDAKAARGPFGELPSEIEYFAQKAEDDGYEPNENRIKQRHQEMCERLRVGPDEHRRKARAYNLCRDTDALWQMFEEAGIDPYDEYAPSVDQIKGVKAFGVNGSVQNAFPVFYQSQIVEGILATPMLDRMVAQTVQVNTGTADHVGLTDTAGQRRLYESGEWAQAVEMTLPYTSTSVPLKKFQGNLKSSSEAIRRARLPLFAAMLRRIGQQLGIDLVDFALDVMIAGHGSAPLGGAATTVATTVTGSPSYADFIALMFSFTDGYDTTDILASATVLAKILAMAEFKDPLAGFTTQRTGALPTPVGWQLHRWDSLGSSNYAVTKVVAWQQDLALVQYNEGGIETETGRIIENDYNQNVIRLYTAFAVWDRAATRVGTGW
jgi:hypothetical protein